MIDTNLFKNISGLLAVTLFGSKARNDNDIYSDTDIFVLTENSADIEEISNSIKLIIKEANVSLYTIEIFEKMLQDGAMFLWHLKIEGKQIYNKYEIDLFKGLKPFNKFKDNFDLYRELFIEAKKSIFTNKINGYDLSMLFFVCRNVSLLTCFKINKPNFGRYSAYQDVITYLEFSPLDWSNYLLLADWRLDYTRGINKDLEYPSIKKMNRILLEVENLLNCCKKIIYEEV